MSRVYWYSAYDLDPDLPTQDGFHADERHYHMGLKRPDGSPKLLARLWEEGGLDSVRIIPAMIHAVPPTPTHVLITGGAGFIGSKLAERLLIEGRSVLLFDILAARGSEANVRELQRKFPGQVALEIADMRDRPAIRRALRGAASVFHLAARQPGEGGEIPILDFDVNAQGTLNLLEELRRLDDPPPLVFTSTSAVYGPLSNDALLPMPRRYQPVDPRLRSRGYHENHPLRPHGSYACSKATSEQYVVDYARRFNLPAVVLRLGHVYGAGREGDHDPSGIIQAILHFSENEPVTIRGDGRQVRDLLHVDDLIEALLLARKRISGLITGTFNIGGGPANAISILELMDWIAGLQGIRPIIEHGDPPPDAHLWDVSDTGRFEQETGWSPSIALYEGLARCYRSAADSGAPRSDEFLAIMGEGV